LSSGSGPFGMLTKLAKFRVGYSTHIVPDVLYIVLKKFLCLSLRDALADNLSTYINTAR
jgi:hypothetical protein